MSRKADFVAEARNALERFETNKDLPTLEEALLASERALRNLDHISPDRFDLLFSYGPLLILRFARTDDVNDLELGISMLEESQQAATDDLHKARVSVNLAEALGLRFQNTGKIADLDRGLDLVNAAMTEEFPGAVRGHALLVAASNHMLRYEVRDNRDELQRAIEAAQDAISLEGLSKDHHLAALNLQAVALRIRHQDFGDPKDLDRAISGLERLRDEADPASSDYPGILDNLANALQQRFDLAHDRKDIEGAVELREHALKLAPEQWFGRSKLLNNAARGLTRRAAISGSLDDVNQAIEWHEEAIDLEEKGSFERGKFVVNLADDLELRSELTKRGDDRAEAMHVLETELKSLQVESPAWTHISNNLAERLLHRFRVHGRVSDLNRSIELLEELVGASPMEIDQAFGMKSGPHQRTRFLVSLGNALVERFSVVGGLLDLNRALMALREAATGPAGSIERVDALASLAEALIERYEHAAAPQDLIQAYDVADSALNESALTEEIAARLLVCLGIFFKTAPDVVEDIDRAVAAGRAADAFERAAVLTHSPDTFIDALGRLGDVVPSITSPEEALSYTSRLIEGLEEILDRRGELEADTRTRGKKILALALLERSGRRGFEADIPRAIELLRAIATNTTEGDRLVALQACKLWGDWASTRGSWAEAAEAYGLGMDALRHLARQQLMRRDKEIWMRLSYGTMVEAAYAAARADDAQAAVAAIEGGRAVILSEVLEGRRSDLALLDQLGIVDLRDNYAKAAETWDSLARENELRETGAMSVTVSKLPTNDERSEGFYKSLGSGLLGTMTATDPFPGNLAAARGELDEAIRAVRSVPGYEDFFEKLSFSEIAEVARDGPLVYVFAAKRGGLALVVTDAAEVRMIWLDDLTDSILHEKTVTFLETYAQRQEAPHLWLKMIEEVGRWLWDVVMNPIIATTGDAGHIWIVPAGLVGLLPLHAAWTDDVDMPTRRRYALDHVAISFTPNARALRDARSCLADSGETDDGVLAILSPGSGEASLRYADQEVREVCLSFARSQVLADEDATVDKVLDRFDSEAVIHFACHGIARLDDPMNSHLRLSDDHLDLKQLMGLSLTRARLGVLSACETAMVGLDLPDEVVSFPTGLLQAGVPSTVGSLWAVFDESTMALMVLFYDFRRGGMSTSDALREDQIWMRDSSNSKKRERFPNLEAFAGKDVPTEARDFWESSRQHLHPYFWAAFVHVGA